MCKNNLLALCYTLGYCLITEDVHTEAIHFFPEKDPNRSVEELAVGIKRRRSLLYPRNTYKSTMDIANCVQLILWYHTTIAILIMSGSKELAFAFVDQVASFFLKESNRPPTLFQALWPELCITKQPTSGEFTAAIRQIEPKIMEPLIWGNSLESSTTGWHPDVLILDDVNNNRNSKSYDSRMRVTKAYKLARKILKPTGIEMKIGTPYGPGDIFNDEILNSRPGTYDRVYKPAMRIKSGDRLDPNGFPEEDEVELLFPSILSYEFLQEEYTGDYTSFMSQYMLDSFGAAEVIFTENQVLESMIDEDRVPMEGALHIHWRLPCKKLGWETANCAVGNLQNGRMYITEIHQGHYKPSLLAALIHSVARKNGTHRISIEDSPGARLMQPTLDNHALTTGWKLNITWTEYSEDAGERETRIRNMEALLAGRRLLFSNGLKKLKNLIEGFVQFGMIAESGLPDVVSRVADNLPVSIAADREDDDLAWEQMLERDKYNMIYGRGAYAPSEPEEEEEGAPEYVEEERLYTDQGLEIMIPGLE